MKFAIKFLAAFTILISAFFLSSCGGDDDPTTTMPSLNCTDGIMNGDELGIDCGGSCPPCSTDTTVEEDKEHIQESFDKAISCLQDIKDAKSVDIILRKFLKLSDGEVLNEDWLENIFEDMEDVVDFDHLDDNSQLDFNHHAGTYMHSATGWQKINNTDDRIEFRFPSDETQTTNNVIVIMDAYQDKQVTIDGESVFLPTAGHMIATADGERIMEVNIDAIEYASNADFEIPVAMNIDIFLDPVDINFNVTRQSTTEFSGSISMSQNGDCTMSIEAELELDDDDFENLNEDSVIKLHGSINMGALSIQSFADMASLFQLDDVTDTDFNSLADVDLLFNNIKIADLEVNDAEETVLLFYKDLSSENSKNYIDDFLLKLEVLVLEFTGSW